MNVKIRLKKQFRLEQIFSNEFKLYIGQFAIKITTDCELISQEIAKLPFGVKEEKLIDLINSKKSPQQESMLLASLHKNCCLEYCFFSSDKTVPSFTISPKRPYAFLADTPSEESLVESFSAYHFSKFSYFRWLNEEVLLENPLSRINIFISDKSLLSYLFSTSKLPESNKCVTILFRELVNENFVLLLKDMEKESIQMWDFPDLLFHKHSRMQESPYPPNFGASFRFEEPKECLKRESTNGINLQKPDLSALLSNDLPLSHVLEIRRTRRRHGATPITKKQLGELLYRVFHFKNEHSEVKKNEFHVYPNAGNIHEFEIYILINYCEDLESGIYQYDCQKNILCRIEANSHDIMEILALAGSAWSDRSHLPQVLINLSCNFSKVFWKYEGIGYRNSLVNAGTIVQTIYLVAEAMNLAACCLGYGCSDLFSKVIQCHPLEQTSILEMAIGTRED